MPFALSVLCCCCSLQISPLSPSTVCSVCKLEGQFVYFLRPKKDKLVVYIIIQPEGPAWEQRLTPTRVFVRGADFTELINQQVEGLERRATLRTKTSQSLVAEPYRTRRHIIVRLSACYRNSSALLKSTDVTEISLSLLLPLFPPSPHLPFCAKSPSGKLPTYTCLVTERHKRLVVSASQTLAAVRVKRATRPTQA